MTKSRFSFPNNLNARIKRTTGRPKVSKVVVKATAGGRQAAGIYLTTSALSVDISAANQFKLVLEDINGNIIKYPRKNGVFLSNGKSDGTNSYHFDFVANDTFPDAKSYRIMQIFFKQEGNSSQVVIQSPKNGRDFQFIEDC